MRQLSAKFVAAVTEPGKYHDGDAGLYLFVRARAGNVSKQFVQRLTIHAKRVDIGLGSTKWMPLTDARATAQANRRIARTGGDPRKGRATVPTFTDGVEPVIAIQRADGATPASLRRNGGRACATTPCRGSARCRSTESRSPTYSRCSFPSGMTSTKPRAASASGSARSWIGPWRRGIAG